MGEERVGRSGAVSRRELLHKGAAAGAIGAGVWVAPAILSVSAAQAASKAPPPQCGGVGVQTQCTGRFLGVQVFNPCSVSLYVQGNVVGPGDTVNFVLLLPSGLSTFVDVFVADQNGQPSGLPIQSFPVQSCS